jgi:hypothetical protein
MLYNKLGRCDYACSLSVTAVAWHQLGRLVRCNGERDVPAQGAGLA